MCCCIRHFTFVQGSAQSIPEAIPSYNTYEKRRICMLNDAQGDWIWWLCPLPTDGALIMHWLCLSLQFATAVGQREEIVADSHRRTCFRFCTFEAAKTGKNQVWMVTQTSCPSVWKLRKWIRAWRKLLVLGSRLGSLATYMTAISSTCTFFAKTIKYKMRKIEMREMCWLKPFWNICSQRQIRFALSQICVREVVSGTSKDQREVRQVRRTNRLQAQNPNFGHRKTIKLWIDWVDYLDNLKL